MKEYMDEDFLYRKIANEIKVEICNLLEKDIQIIDDAPINIYDIDSLLYIELIIKLEENYNCTFLSNLIVTDQLNTVRKITMYIIGEING